MPAFFLKDDMKYLIENLSQAPQGVHTTRGLVHLKPGHRRLLDLDEGSHDRVSSLPFFCVADIIYTGSVDQILTGDAKGQALPPIAGEGDLDAMTDEELAAAYEAAMGKKPHHKAKRETIIAQMRGA